MELLTRETLGLPTDPMGLDLSYCICMIRTYVSIDELPYEEVFADGPNGEEVIPPPPIIVRGDNVSEVTPDTPVVVQWRNLATGRREHSMPLSQGHIEAYVRGEL